MKRLVWLLSVLLVTGGLLAAPALAEKRVALVIGNDRYPNLPPERQLQKAVNDAEAVGDTLGRLGFYVIRGHNLGRQAMFDRLAELTARLEPGDTAVFFYAGHGVAIGGANYLVPSDVPAVTEGAEVRVRGASIAEADVIAEIQARNIRVAVLVLDACRDNPFPRAAGRAIGNTRGLTDARPARGVFTLYSAGIGQSALDRLERTDQNRNSVFTRVFVEYLARPGFHLGDLAVEVRERVAALALTAKDELDQPYQHEQTPAYYDQTIGGRVYLAGLPKPAPPLPAVPPADEIAWTAPAEPPRSGRVPDPEPHEIARLVQTELRRLGCYPGSVDGDWSVMTRRALELFNKHAGLQLATKVASLDALDATRSKTSRICPLVCERGYHAEREACVKTVCTAGLVLGEDGACVKRPERPAAQPSAKRPTPTRTAKPSDGGSHASGDARKRAAGGGHVTCGRNGCQTVPAGCHAVRGAGGGGLGGKIFCP